MPIVVSAAEMADLDRQTSERFALSSRVLMEVAGRAVADVAAKLLPPQAAVLLCCGSGNNAGDGFVAARALCARGFAVQVFVFADRQKLQGTALEAFLALESAANATLTVGTGQSTFAAFDQAPASLIVDALLGIGLTSEVRGAAAEAIKRINQRRSRDGCAVLSVDLPSGLQTDTGQIMGTAVKASHTVTFGCAKFAHYLHPGARLCGTLSTVDIGLAPPLFAQTANRSQVVLPEAGPKLVPKRPANSHKGTFGHLVVVAGSPSQPGAAMLTLQAALRSGVGLVSWSVDDATLALSACRPAEIMLRPRPNLVSLSTHGASAVAVGPGLGVSPATAELMQTLLQSTQVPVCIDADGLNVLAAHPHLWEFVQPNTVLTPHPKEMARLLGGNAEVAAIQQDRVGAARAVSTKRRCIVVLKGAGTVVCDPQGRTALIAAGGPALATGGTGDVLCGAIGSLLAQQLDPWVATQAAVLLHGCAGEAAARHFGEAGVLASDVVEAMGEVWVQWRR